MPLIKYTESIPEIFTRAGCSRINIISGTVLFYQKFQPIGYYYLLKGKVKVVKELPLGGEKMVGIMTGGQFLGIRDFVAGLSYNFTTVALEAGEAFFISSSLHSKLIENTQFSSLLIKADAWPK